jgi:gamma-glutamylcyclotransferase (GGCT)/AIG2-like uncharacterized protein YtfP
MNKDGLYVFYGTLRLSMENHTFYADGMNYIDTVTLPGYRLISLGDYPYAVATGDLSNKIKAELFRLNEQQAKAIYEMELEAGYYYEDIQIGQKKYGIFLFSQVNPDDEEISSGDWEEYVRERGF